MRPWTLRKEPIMAPFSACQWLRCGGVVRKFPGLFGPVWRGYLDNG